jgi:hypothetical protein
MRSVFSLVAALLLISACAHEDPRQHAQDLAKRGGLIRSEFQTRDFLLVAYSRIDDPRQPVHAYFEGDGLAWISRSRLSDDPTPHRAVGLALAAADPAPNVIYLARPCQYIDLRAHPCDSAWWSGKRFAEEVIRSQNEALDTLMRGASGREIHLVGYSGGAAIAVLVAARRDDIASIRTVAGNLDSEAINRFHGVSPMPDSLNPIDVASALVRIPQIHFIGKSDTVVPASIAARFAAAATGCARVVTIVGPSHESGWAEQWPTLLAQMPACAP